MTGSVLALDLVEHYNTAQFTGACAVRRAGEHEKAECRSGDHDKRPEKAGRPHDLTQ